MWLVNIGRMHFQRGPGLNLRKCINQCPSNEEKVARLQQSTLGILGDKQPTSGHAHSVGSRPDAGQSNGSLALTAGQTLGRTRKAIP